MAKAKRVVFSFDDRSLDSLEQIKLEGKYSSYADVVRDSLKVSRALQHQSEQGFTEILVRNPQNGEERVMVVPPLRPQSK